MIKPKPIIGRVGGKVRLAPWIIEHLKRFQWSIYCGTVLWLWSRFLSPDSRGNL
jgi:hypothetical protein